MGKKTKDTPEIKPEIHMVSIMKTPKLEGLHKAINVTGYFIK